MADMVENKNYNALEKQFWEQHKRLKRHQRLEKPGTHRCIWCNRLDFVNATDRDAHTENNECGHVPEVAPGTIDDCTPQSLVTPIVELGGIWCINKSMGMTVNCTDLLVYPEIAADACPFALPAERQTPS